MFYRQYALWLILSPQHFVPIALPMYQNFDQKQHNLSAHLAAKVSSTKLAAQS
jgi:hypothetical protein